MDSAAVQVLCNRLSASPEVEQKLPWRLRSREEGLTQDEKRAHLTGLLSRDAALFLEKFGGDLSGEELSHFSVLKGDYEVNWHLNRLTDDLTPSPRQEKVRAALVKNRRLAFMQRLEDEGSYFTEDAMRERAPLLHEQFMGLDAAVPENGERQPVVPRPGEGLSELIIRQAKEDQIAAKLKQERAEFAKEAAEAEGTARAAATIGRGQEEIEEDTSERGGASKPPSDLPPGLPSLDTPLTTAKARVAPPRKVGRVRFGAISGASVAGAPGVTSASPASTSAATAVPESTTVPSMDAQAQTSGRGAAEASGAARRTEPNGRSPVGNNSGGSETVPDRSHVVSTSSVGPPSGSGHVQNQQREVSNGASQVNANGHSVNDLAVYGKNVNRGSVNVNRGSVNGPIEGEEQVSHARFGEFTTPEPVSTSRIASQVVRSVLESAGAGPRHPVTRYGEVLGGRFGQGSDKKPEVSDKQAGISDEQSGGMDKGSGQQAAVSGRGAQGSTAVGSSAFGGLRGTGDGDRMIRNGDMEEMDTDEEDLGSRTYTDTSELGGDTVDVDSGRKGQIDDFRRVMRERFLEGQDEEHVDYRMIDSDTRLDDDWLGQVDRDAQEKYFDED